MTEDARVADLGGQFRVHVAVVSPLSARLLPAAEEAAQKQQQQQRRRRRQKQQVYGSNATYAYAASGFSARG